MWEAGCKVVAQRKLLFLEKLFASVLLGGPRVKEQLANRIQQLQQQDSTPASAANVELLLKVLKALSLLINFFLPAVFRVGFKVRNCTWAGRKANSGVWAREVMEEVVILLIHLLQDVDCKNEYVRTLSVAIATWQPWMNKIPAVCFVEESCEAMLSRMGHRCDVYRTLHGFDHTYNLFLTLPCPKKTPKATRGMLKDGLVQVFAARIRKIVFSDGRLPFAPNVGAREMHAILEVGYPPDFSFPGEMQATDSAVYEHVIRRGLRCLIGKVNLNPKVKEFMDTNVVATENDDAILYERCITDLHSMFKVVRRQRPAVPKPKPQAKKTFMPKPKGILILLIDIDMYLLWHKIKIQTRMRLNFLKS